MTKNDKPEEDRQGWIIGGTTLIGLGVGFILLEQSALLFVASIVIGVGVGLVISSFISDSKKESK